MSDSDLPYEHSCSNTVLKLRGFRDISGSQFQSNLKNISSQIPISTRKSLSGSTVLGCFLKKIEMAFDGRDYMVILTIMIMQVESEEVRI